MKRQSVRRFYKAVTVAEREQRHAVLLDGKPAKTPCGAPLVTPTRALADAIAQEWRVQGERLDAAGMMLTGLASSAIDRVGAQRGDIVEHVLAFGRSDVLCYRAEEPSGLRTRQSQVWDPLLAWAHSKHGIKLIAGAGVAFIEQPVDALLHMQALVAGLDDFQLAAQDTAAALTGSFVLALALVEGRLDAEDAFTAAHADELYQAETWGRDAEAESRRKRILDELKVVENFLCLLHDIHPKYTEDTKTEKT